MTSRYSGNLAGRFALMALLFGWLSLSSPVLAADPIIITGITLNGGNVNLTFTSEVGVDYVVQYSDDFLGWISSGPPITGTGSTTSVQLGTSGAARRFYHIARDGGGGGTVYSVNAVGYINVSAVAGWNLIANPLISGNYGVPSLFPFVPFDTEISKVGPSSMICNHFFEDFGWLDCATFDPSTITLRPGEGAILNAPEAFTATFVGEVPGGFLKNYLPAGWSLCSSIFPQQGPISTALGFPAQDGDSIFKFNSVNQTYDSYFFDVDTWFPSEPVINPGEAFWALLGAPVVWQRTIVEPGGGGLSITNYPSASGPQGGAAPSITSQPQSRTNLVGSTATFSVTASGTQPFTYRWSFANSPIPGATNRNYTIPSVQLTNQGSYFVTVSNASGSAQSASAILTVYAPPSISVQPVGVATNLGASVTFSVVAGGSPAPHFQWRRNGINILNATNSSYTIPAVQLSDGGTYTVVVANLLDALISNPATLLILATNVPGGDNFVDRVRIVGATGLISGSNNLASKETGEPLVAGETGGPSVWWVWNAPANGILKVGTVGSSFDTLLGLYSGPNVSNLTVRASDDDAGGGFASALTLNVIQGTDYAIVIDGFGGSAGYYLLNWDLEVTADQVPVIVNAPTSVTVAPGATHTFGVTPEIPNPAYEFRWFFNDVPIGGGTNQTLTISNITESALGNYSVRVTLGGRLVQTKAASLQINVSGTETQPVLAFDKLVDAINAPTQLRLGTPPSGGGLLAQGKSSHGLAQQVARGYSGTQIFNNYGTTSEGAEEVHCGVICGTSEWIPFVAQEEGVLYLNTDGSMFDTVLAVYARSNSMLMKLNCDNNSGTNGVTSALQVRVPAGQTNFVVVDGVGGAIGVLHLNYVLVTPSSISVLGNGSDGNFRFRITGHSTMKFVIQTSSNAIQWLPGTVVTAPNATFDVIETISLNTTSRFYRVLMLP